MKANKLFAPVAILILLTISACGKEAVADKSAESKVIAEVNDEKITQSEFDKYYQMETFNTKMNLAGLNDGSNTITPQIDQRIKEVVFEELVYRKILWQEAAAQNIDISETSINDAYQQMMKSQDQAAYEQMLQGTGLKEGDVRDILKTQLIYIALTANISNNISISDAEVQQYYVDNYSKKLGVRHILLENEKIAKDLIVQLLNGADFAQLAQQNSICPSKAQGGDLGLREPNKWIKEFEEAAFNLKAGEITPIPVKTTYGYHIIKAEPGRSLPEVEEDVIAALRQEKEKEAVNIYLEDLRNKYVIKDYRSQ